MMKPADISDASEDAKQRGSADKRTYQVYNYKDHNMFFNSDDLGVSILASILVNHKHSSGAVVAVF